MSEMLVTFQTQLSGVMETVFKAAIFEISRLVEVSFVDEVSRSREQVESLKKKLQLSENREKTRCDCSRSKSLKMPVQKKDSITQTGSFAHETLGLYKSFTSSGQIRRFFVFKWVSNQTSGGRD